MEDKTIRQVLEALQIASQFMNIAAEWNFDEAEINGDVRATYDWLSAVDAAIVEVERVTT